jgi:hypothetical protein
MLRRAQARLWDAFLRYLTTPMARGGPTAAERVESLAGVLCRGDVLLSEVADLEPHQAPDGSPGRTSRCMSGRSTTRTIRGASSKPTLRRACGRSGSPELDALNVRVLRPASLDSTKRSRLAEWVTSRIGSEYDHDHALRLGRRLLRLPLRSRAGLSAGTAASTATRFICCSLLAHAFASVGLAIAPVRTCPDATACADPASITPGDFEQASVFEVIGLSGR